MPKIRQISRRRQMLEDSKIQKDALEGLRQVDWDESRATLRVDLKNVSNFYELLDEERKKGEQKKEKALLEQAPNFANASSAVDALLDQEGVAAPSPGPDMCEAEDKQRRDVEQPAFGPCTLLKESDLDQTLKVTPPTIQNSNLRGEAASPGFSIVLKLTTFSADEVTSFELTGTNAVIGRGPQNTVSIPEDVTMDDERHAEVFCERGQFFLQHGQGANGTFVRLRPSSSKCSVHGEQAFALRLEWALEKHTVFKVGTTEFEVVSVEENEDAQISLHVLGVEGKLKGKDFTITAPGVSIGRSNENGISTGDGEVSRRHAQINFCKHTRKFMLRDLSSTNGTYIRLCGPNQGVHPLRINDEIMVARTCMSINRHDATVAETRGRRSTMEDEKRVEQDLQVTALSTVQTALTSNHDLYERCRIEPQSYFAVYDGHGGNECSKFLSLELHNHVRETLEHDALEFSKTLESTPQMSPEDAEVAIDAFVISALKTAFADADRAFLNNSDSTAGSTAVTALLLGRRLYVSNVGDSRCVLCRGGVAVPMSDDHKPHLEPEAERIKMAGGFVLNKRVMGELAVSRAFGDRWLKVFDKSDDDEDGDNQLANSSVEVVKFEDSTPREGEVDGGWTSELKESLVISEPDIKVTVVGPDDHFLLLACDGLYDVMTSQEAVDFVIAQLADHNDIATAAQHLVDEAVRKRTRDNVTVALVRLNGSSLSNDVFKSLLPPTEESHLTGS